MQSIFEGDQFGENVEAGVKESIIRAKYMGLGEPRIERGEAMTIAGLNRGYTFQTRHEIPGHWNEFQPHLTTTPNRVGTYSYGLNWRFTEDGFDYLTGVEISTTDDLPDGFISIQVDVRPYVVFVYEGHISAIDQIIDRIWTQWVPECKVPVAPVPSFERYSEAYDTETGYGGAELWVPLDERLKL